MYMVRLELGVGFEVRS